MKNEKGVVFVVGAGDYIGSAIARRFASAGHPVCVGRRNEEKLAPLVETIRNAGGTVHPLRFDARDEDLVVDRFAHIEAEIGALEAVIFNIGGNVNFPLAETTARVFRKVWELCCFAGFLTGREAAKHMVPRRAGSIFFTGATASLRGGNGYSAFASGKFALRALAQSMARELGPQGIHVAHLIIDAGVDTEWVRDRIRESRGIDPDTLPEHTLMDPESVARAYWSLHQQTRDAWTFELDLRPFGESW